MGKKKSFIDKKNSSTYHILHRSQRDVAEDATDGGGDGLISSGGGSGGGVVLWPSPDNNRETDQKVLLGNNQAVQQLKDVTLSSWKSTLSKAGLVDDFDYDKYTKPIRGTGQYVSNTALTSSSASKKQVGAMVEARNLVVQDEIVQEVDRLLDSIALTSDCMDDDIAQALFGDFDEANFEELNDEFVLDAAQEPEEEDDDDDDTDAGGFDFSAHIKNLVDKAKLESQGDETGGLATIHELGRQDHAYFSKAKPIRKGMQQDDDDDEDSGYFDETSFEIQGTPGVVPQLTSEEEQALCDKFNATLAEYDSDDLGEGNDDDAYGDLSLEGDAQVETALNDFLQEKEDDVFFQGTRYLTGQQRHGGSGFSALVGTKMVPIKDISKFEQAGKTIIHPINDILGEADDTLADPLHAPPAEEIFIDGKSYFSEKIRNPWDCESILSTYSNLDNNPVTIRGGGSGRRRKQKNKNGNPSGNAAAQTEEDDEHQILLSEKTGLPLGVLSSPREDMEEDEFADTFLSVNKGEARRKSESAEEKKQRKVNVKKERQLARMQKKMMKEAFNDEFAKRQQEVMVDDVGGKAVFRF